ncbi:hypothetical protein HPB50_024314 [Hyalomma asiaticum]|uniref:Uncharacterized protein n=1 Tax=Hyalomma asiaticum TaxID=266040 RepID=A0ACB7TBB4_HYAAI|nr:hypothetical protein HPB50_024314 [Hyalomma asiaticum]
MALGALLTKHHASEALDSATKQAQFLADTIPAVLHKPINDIGLIMGPNLNNFSAALDDRLQVCSEEGRSALDVLAKDPLLEFATTAADRLSAVMKFAGEIEKTVNSGDFRAILESWNETAALLMDAAYACTKATCTKITKIHLNSSAKELKTIQEFMSKPFNFPPSIATWKLDPTQEKAAALRQVTKVRNVKLDLATHAEALQKELKEFGDRLNETVGQLNDSVKRVVERANSAAAYVRDPPDDVKTRLRLYKTLVVTGAAIVTVITAIYMFGNQCIMWRARTGFFSFTTASRAMLAAGFMFLLFFPMFMVVSTLGTTMGLAIDSKLCAPALDPGAPSSRPFIEFLAAKLGTQEATTTSAIPQEYDRRRAGLGSATVRRKRAAVSSPKNRTRRTERLAAANRGTVLKSQDRFKTLERRRVPRSPRRRRRQSPRGEGSGGGDDVQQPADITSALGREITPKAAEAILRRFVQCSNTGLSTFELLGRDLVTRMAKIILGRDSPWLALVRDAAGSPKLEALEKWGSEIPKLDNSVKSVFEKVGEVPMLWTDDGLLWSISSTVALSSLKEALRHKDNFRAKMKYVKGHVAKWDSMRPDLHRSIRDVLSVSRKAKEGFKKDLVLYFSDAKEQASCCRYCLKILERVGDCRQLYALYMSTVETVCVQGVPLLIIITCRSTIPRETRALERHAVSAQEETDYLSDRTCAILARRQSL